MAPDSGTASFTPSHPGEESQRLAEVHGRLSLALDRASTFGAFVDPRVLAELRDVVGEVLELIGDRPTAATAAGTGASSARSASPSSGRQPGCRRRAGSPPGTRSRPVSPTTRSASAGPA